MVQCLVLRHFACPVQFEQGLVKGTHPRIPALADTFFQLMQFAAADKSDTWEVFNSSSYAP